jgi:hypothetical protein
VRDPMAGSEGPIEFRSAPIATGGGRGVTDSRPPDKPLHEVNAAGHRLARAAGRYVEQTESTSPLFCQLKEAVKDYERADKRAQLEATL